MKAIANIQAPRYRETRVGEVFSNLQCDISELEGKVRESNSQAVVLFLASDIGCVANQGNRAAEHGPKAIQDALFLMQQHSASSDYFEPSVHLDASRLLLLEAELADLQAESTTLNPRVAEDNLKLCGLVERAGQRARLLIEPLLRAEVPLSMVVGGGDNYGYDCISAIMRHEGSPVIVVNFDPHADVRDSVCPTSPDQVPTTEKPQFARHSGNWVSQAMSEGLVHAYIPVGLDPLRNNSWTMAFLKRHNVQWQLLRKQLLCSQLSECLKYLDGLIASFDPRFPIYFNFDADSVKGVHVSALNPDGLDPQQAYRIARHMLDNHGPRIKIARLAEIGGSPDSPLRTATGLFGANFITSCMLSAASASSPASPTASSASSTTSSNKRTKTS